MKFLYIIATPIGNMEDITFRAISVLKDVDVIICEDTRQTIKLLKRYGISKKLISLHQHSSDEKTSHLLTIYDKIAYASDAGTPGISDPGNKIVKIAVQLGMAVIPIPGACAAIAALSVSGFPTDKFLFLGFMPHKSKGKIMKQIAESQITVCFYDSPHRIVKTLEEFKNYINPGRQLVVCRELTKQFESIYRGTLDEVLNEIKEKQKGEFAVIVSAKG